MSTNRMFLALGATALAMLVTGCKVENRGAGAVGGESTASSNTDNPAIKLESGLKAADHDALQCHLDLASGRPVSGPVTIRRGQGASFEGWAFETGHGALAESQMVLQGPAGSYHAKVKGGAARPDVASSFGAELENAGFTTVVDISNVAAGDYTLWLATGTEESDKACDLKAIVKIED